MAPGAKSWSCPRGEACQRAHAWTLDDAGATTDDAGRVVMPAYIIAPAIAGPGEDDELTHCPAHDLAELHAAGGLYDLWTISDGRLAELTAVIPRPAAALVEAWGVLGVEMARLRAEVARWAEKARES